jgi:hypothetical protein
MGEGIVGELYIGNGGAGERGNERHDISMEMSAAARVGR